MLHVIVGAGPVGTATASELPWLPESAEGRWQPPRTGRNPARRDQNFRILRRSCWKQRSLDRRLRDTARRWREWKV